MASLLIKSELCEIGNTILHVPTKLKGMCFNVLCFLFVKEPTSSTLASQSRLATFEVIWFGRESRLVWEVIEKLASDTLVRLG